MRFATLTSLILSLSTLSAGLAAAQNKPPLPITALSVLKAHEPTVTWVPSSLLKADFDFDGKDDYAFGGRAGARYVVGIVKGPVTDRSKYWTLGFSQNAGDQGALCSTSTASITPETPDIEGLDALPPNSKGINLADGACDSFHIYWDRQTKRFVWSRN
jgi:hypothetical protein